MIEFERLWEYLIQDTVDALLGSQNLSPCTAGYAGAGNTYTDVDSGACWAASDVRSGQTAAMGRGLETYWTYAVPYGIVVPNDWLVMIDTISSLTSAAGSVMCDAGSDLFNTRVAETGAFLSVFALTGVSRMSTGDSAPCFSDPETTLTRGQARTLFNNHMQYLANAWTTFAAPPRACGDQARTLYALGDFVCGDVDSLVLSERCAFSWNMFNVAFGARALNTARIGGKDWRLEFGISVARGVKHLSGDAIDDFGQLVPHGATDTSEEPSEFFDGLLAAPILGKVAREIRRSRASEMSPLPYFST